MLHHFMMCTFFAGSMAHVLVFEDMVGYRFSLNTILFMVLLQHLLHQVRSYSQAQLCRRDRPTAGSPQRSLWPCAPHSAAAVRGWTEAAGATEPDP
jgi:hypothetical protein